MIVSTLKETSHVLFDREYLAKNELTGPTSSHLGFSITHVSINIAETDYLNKWRYITYIA